MKSRILLVCSDTALADAFAKACEARGVIADCVRQAAEARRRWTVEETRLLGCAADTATITPQDRLSLLQWHLETGAPPLLVLDPPGLPDPVQGGPDPILRLRWPLDNAFLERLRNLAAKPMVFLADQTLFLTGMLGARLQAAGIHPLVTDSSIGMVESLQDITLKGEGGGRSLWAKLKPGEAAKTPDINPTALTLWKGDAFDADSLMRRARQALPEVRFFHVTSAGSIHTVERALRRGRPAFLPRESVALIPDILSGRPVLDPKELGRVLLVDNFKPSLIQLATGLMADGYEVAGVMKGEEAIELALSDRFHLAVVGAALAYAQHTGIELAQKLREMDPDLRIILMVERYPLQAALQGVSQVVEVGLDDCLLKPVEPSRLKFSISRALERRRLLLENARLLDELKASNQQLAQLTGFQSKFFATVAHDVKNPLTAIRGYADLLSWRVKDSELLKLIGHIQSSSKTLQALVSDLVDFAAIEAGKLRVNLEEMDLAAVITDVRSRIQVVADKKQIRFEVTVPDGLPKISGDPLRIGQVVQNLCTNAIQYTPEKGTVHLRVQRSPTYVTVGVHDTGIGISKEDLPRIFERFFQAENAQKMRRAGFGLGLKISQEIVKAHGGGIGVDSELGKGSVFYFTLPLPVPAQGTPPTPAPGSVQTPPPSAVQTPAPAPPQPVRPFGGPPTPPPRPITKPPQ